jgi:hypothetical protein
MEEKSKAYLEGIQAAKEGKTPRDNPYIRGEEAYSNWLDGLITASL